MKSRIRGIVAVLIVLSLCGGLFVVVQAMTVASEDPAADVALARRDTEKRAAEIRLKGKLARDAELQRLADLGKASGVPLLARLARARGSTPVLVIPSGDLEPGTFRAITEDMNIMASILDKCVEPGPGVQGPTQALYIEGYGALFLMKADFPLAAPPTAEAQKPEAPADSVWEQTRRELYMARRGRPRIVGGRIVFDRPARGSVPYDEGKVKALKKALLEALKNASNMRHLKPDEAVAIAVTGGDQGGIVHMRTSGASEREHIYQILTQAGIGHGRTVLTLHARKSDVDAFAKDDLSFDQFSEKVRTFAYSSLG